MKIHWKPSVRASAWYAADGCLAQVVDPIGRVAEPQVAALTDVLAVGTRNPQPLVRGLLDALITAEGAGDAGGTEFWQDAARQWLDREQVAAGVRDTAVALLDQLWDRFSTSTPQLADELTLRIRPLREMWEAYGPGMMHFLRQRLWPDQEEWSPTVLVVHPARGGGGRAWVGQPTVMMEAVLVNRWPRLPEVVRLAWLLAHFPAARAAAHGVEAFREVPPPLWPAALLPAVLAAAESVELAVLDTATLDMASREWFDRGKRLT